MRRETGTTHTAVFSRVEEAKAFAVRVIEPGWWLTDVVQKGRTVTFTDRIPTEAMTHTTPREAFLDLLETVGYYGSSQRRKATLDGVPAPVSY